MAERATTDGRGRLARAGGWRRQLFHELSLLPETMADLRTTIADLRTLSARLEKATAGIEVMIRHAETSGLADLARKVDEAATLLEQQSAAGTDLASAAIDELQRTLAKAAQLFPGLPPTRRT